MLTGKKLAELLESAGDALSRQDDGIAILFAEELYALAAAAERRGGSRVAFNMEIEDAPGSAYARKAARLRKLVPVAPAAPRPRGVPPTPRDRVP